MDWEERKQRSQDLSMRLLSFPFHMSVLYEFSACSALSGLLMMFLQGVIPHHSFEWDLVWSSPCTGITQCSLPALTPGGDALHPAEVPCSTGQFLQPHLPAPATCSGQGVEDRTFWGSRPSNPKLPRPLSTLSAHLWTSPAAVWQL